MTDKDVYENPEKFHEMLAGIQGEEIPDEEEPKETGEEEEKEEEEVLEEGEEEGEAGETEDEEEDLEEEKEEEPEDKTEERMIPKARFNEVIEERNQLRVEGQETRDRLIRTETELNNLKLAVQEMMKPQEVVDEFEPLDEEADKRYKKELEPIKKKLDDIEREKENKEALHRFESELNHDQQTFTAKQPDFPHAWQHIQQARIEQEKVLLNDGKMSEDELNIAAQHAAIGHLYAIALEAKKRGKNAAEVIYNMAKSPGYGYAPKAEGKKSDLGAIKRNQSKSPGITKVQGAAVSGNISSTEDLIRKIRVREGKGPVDPKKFHETLKKIQQSV